MSDQIVGTKKRKWFKVLLWVVLFFLLLFCLVALLLQFQPVQNWVAHKTTDYISIVTDSEVDIGRVDVSISKGFVFEDINVSKDTDTLLRAKAFSVGLNSSLTSLFSNKLDLKNIILDSPRLRIVTPEDRATSNLQEFLKKLSSGEGKSSEKSSGAMDLALDRIQANNVDIDIIHRQKNTQQTIDVGRLDLKISSLDNGIVVDELVLDRPIVRLKKLGGELQVNTESKVVKDAVKETESKQDTVSYKVDEIKIIDGVFSFDDDTKVRDTARSTLDYAHFELYDIDLDIESLQLENGGDLTFKLHKLSFVDDKDFEVRQIKANTVTVNSKQISLQQFLLETRNSRIGDAIELKFASFDDFSDFERKVRLKANIRDGALHLGDLLHFVKPLNDSPFFTLNKKRNIRIDGKFGGVIDRLYGRDMELSIDDRLKINANFSTRNLTRKDQELVNLGVKSLTTDISFLKTFIPDFTPPSNFYKLGMIDFKGRFDGYFKDFVAFGSVNTQLGSGFLDMRLDAKEGLELANYSGDLSLENFDMKTWTGNDDFGIVNFSTSIDEGKGLSIQSIHADLYAVVETFSYKNYEYKDFIMDGVIDKNRFEGEFSIDDEHASMVFEGSAELRDSIPYLNFKADIQDLDLYKLNLIGKPFEAKGKIDINAQGKDLNSLLGYVKGSNLQILTNDTIYTLDTLHVQSAKGKRSNALSLYSELGTVQIRGDYDIDNLVPSFKRLFKKNYPHYTQNWKLDNSRSIVEQDIDFEVEIRNTKNILELAGVKGLKFRDLKLKGKLDTRKGDLSVAGTVPFVRYEKNYFYGNQLIVASTDSKGDLYVTIDSLNISGRGIPTVDVESKMKGDTVNISVGTSNVADEVKRLSLAAEIVPHEKGYKLHIDDKDIQMLGQQWQFTKQNDVVFGEEYIDINNLKLHDGKRTISIKDVQQRGVSLELEDFNFSTIDEWINFKGMRFAGVGNTSVIVDDIFTKNTSIEGNILIPTFTINKDTFGTLELDVVKKTDTPYSIYFGLGNNGKGLICDATLDPAKGNYLYAEAKADDFQLKIFEYLLSDGISEVYGDLDVTGTIKGRLDELAIEAVALVTDAGLKVNYTGAKYTLDNQKARCTEREIDFTGAVIRDANGRPGYITGGLFHELFSNFSIDANITGNDVIAVDTKKGDNDIYYGLAKGDVSVDFKGPFDRMNMNITCTSREGTEINIPIGTGENAANESFIEFVDRDALFNKVDTGSKKDFKIEGINIELNMTLTPDAQVNLIFDESNGDIIKGRGSGNIRLFLSRYGDFDMYGDYTIEEGNYLFTALGVVAKPFKVRRGGTIRWTGDPINALLDIKADYQVRTPLQIFLKEYLIEGSPAWSQANNRTDVSLILELGGTLYKPDVQFDLDFPNLSGQIASVVNSKMISLRNNQANLNNQVLGLIVFNTFLPSTNSGGTGVADIGAAGVSTLSEFLSSQLSILFTGLINDALTEDGLISGIDFEIGLNKNSLNGVNQSSGDILPDEIEVNLKNRFRFLDERLSLKVGGNYVRQSVLRSNSNYFVGDFVLEYYLTTNRKLKLQMYGKYDYDEYLLGRRQKYGLGIGYRTEFGSLTDLKEGLKKQLLDDIKSQ